MLDDRVKCLGNGRGFALTRNINSQWMQLSRETQKIIELFMGNTVSISPVNELSRR